MDLTGDVKRSAKDRGAKLVDIASVNRLADATEGHRAQDYFALDKSDRFDRHRLGYAPIEDLPKHICRIEKNEDVEATALAIFPCTSASSSL